MSNNLEESNPLLYTNINKQHENESNPKNSAVDMSLSSSAPLLPPKEHPIPPMPEPHAVDGMPLRVLGQPIPCRAPWSSELSQCFGSHDQFCGSDLEVCILGSIAPCVLYASNAERLRSNSGSFTSHCMTYTTLYLIGNLFFGWNCLAPWFSYTSRTALRRGFNLEGSCEALTRSCGCCGSLVEDPVQREQLEMACDIATHLFCHPCSLCQEGREIRRRLPHPTFNAQQIVVMVPPEAQSMGRP